MSHCLCHAFVGLAASGENPPGSGVRARLGRVGGVALALPSVGQVLKR